MKVILETDRLVLREFVLDDLEDFFRMVSDPDVTRFTGGVSKTIAQARKVLEERTLQDYQKRGYGRWAVVDKYPNCNGTPGSQGCGGLTDSPTNPNLKRYLESEPVSGGLQPTATICFVVPDPPASPALAGTVGQPLTVRVESEFSFEPILNMFDLTLRGKATMRIEQTPAVLQSQGVTTCP